MFLSTVFSKAKAAQAILAGCLILLSASAFAQGNLTITGTVREATGEEREEILSGFLARSEEIKSPDFVEDRYARFAREMEHDYLFRFSGRLSKVFLFRILNKLTSYRFLKLFYQDRYRASIENVLECEAHRELAAKALRGREE